MPYNMKPTSWNIDNGQREKMNWITEKNYAEIMQNEVEPYIASRKTCGFDTRINGEPIYYERYLPDNPKAVIVISHGFTESIQKYKEAVYYMLQAGYEVWGLDHRGHGYSCRLNKNPYVVHTVYFKDYVLDLVHLTKKLVRPAAGHRPVFLYCHSMGGCIGAWTIEKYPRLFDKAVLSSPMLGLSFGKIPVPIAYVGAKLKSLKKGLDQPLSPVNEMEPEDFENSCDSSACRYHYYYQRRLSDKRLQTRSPSIGWGMEAAKACARVTSRCWTSRIRIPVLLCQAGNDTVVKNSSQNRFVSRVKGCRFFRMPNMKHELYMTDSIMLIQYWERVFSFLTDKDE